MLKISAYFNSSARKTYLKGRFLFKFSVKNLYYKALIIDIIKRLF